MKKFLSLLTLSMFAMMISFTASAQSDKMMDKGDKMEKKMDKKMDKMDKHDDSMMAKKDMMAKGEPIVIKLSQNEGVYTTQGLTLAPGNYIFEVSNLEVDKGLGFYLQDASEAQVANSGVAALVEKGKTQRTGVVTLTEGTYHYSCPLNPTPQYTLMVK